MKTTMRQAMLFLTILLLGMLGTTAGQQATTQEETVRDEDIKVSYFEDLTYPPLARIAGVQGVVVVRVRLDANGNVVDSMAVSGAKLLIPECLTNAKKWRFRPNAQKAAVIVYNFRILDGACRSITSQFVAQAPNVASITTCLQPTSY